jgi:hypothetical protein
MGTGFCVNLQPSKAEAGFDMQVPPLEDVHELECIIHMNGPQLPETSPTQSASYSVPSFSG